MQIFLRENENSTAMYYSKGNLNRFKNSESRRIYDLTCTSKTFRTNLISKDGLNAVVIFPFSKTPGTRKELISKWVRIIKYEE